MTTTLSVSDPVSADFADEVGAAGPVAVEGARTRWTLGGESKADTRLLKAPTGIVEFVPEEMTVRVRAGTTVLELQQALADKGQRTALPDRGGTVGGALAVGQNDYRVLGRRRVRSSLLRLRYISAEGRVITGGGPTVKNVSGFDLPRLMVGSLGTLGMFAEVILRTNPIPPVSRWLRSSDADPIAVHAALLAPSVIMWDGDATIVQLEGHPPDVVAEHEALGAVGSFEEIDEPLPPSGHRWSLMPAELTSLDRSKAGTFVALIGVGTVYADNPPPVRTTSSAIRTIHQRLKAEFDPTNRLNPGRVVGLV